MFASSFRVGLAILAATTAAYAAEDTVLLISPDCSPSQFGEAPSTLAGDLLDGYGKNFGKTFVVCELYVC